MSLLLGTSDPYITSDCPQCYGRVTCKEVVTWKGNTYYRLVGSEHDECFGPRVAGNLWPSTALRR